jgi:hypothetical protein
VQFTYFLLDNGAGKPHEIYRSTMAGQQFSGGELQRAKRDGSWSAASSEVSRVVDLWLKGDFDPDEDTIAELQAFAYLRAWRSGQWPGRP